MNAFHEVSELEFYTYLEDIKNRLKTEAPEWHVNVLNDPGDRRTLYHICQFDFITKKCGKPKIKMYEGVFAYTKDGKHYLFNTHPIS